MSTTVRNYFDDNFGLDFTSISIGNKYLSDCSNCISRNSSGCQKRKGTQHKVSDIGGYGLIPYSYVDSDGLLVEELLVADEDLYKVEEGTFTIAYSGAQTHVKVTVSQEQDGIRMQIIENGSAIMDRDMGIGFEESSTDTLASLKTAIDALTGLSATISNTTTIPSAFLDITKDLYIQSGDSGDIKYKYTTQIPTTLPKSFPDLKSLKGTDRLHNIRHITHNDQLFLADGGKLKVYDGQHLYLAGLPKPSEPIFTPIGFGPLDGTYNYYISYEQTNFQGLRTESVLSDVATIELEKKSLVLAVPTLTDRSGYNTYASRVDGDQSATVSAGKVTLTVLAGQHDLVAGDTALLKNRNISGSPLKTYEIDSVTSTTIVVNSTEDITVEDGDIVSNDLRINVYRSLSPSTSLDLVAELPNDSFNGSMNIQDGYTGAYISGTQADLEANTDGHIWINVDDGAGGNHDLIEGDTICLFNAEEDIKELQTYNVLERTDTTIKIGVTGKLTVNDNQSVAVTRVLSEYVFPITTQSDPGAKNDLVTSYKGNLVTAHSNRIEYSDDINNGLITSSQSFPPVNFVTFPDKITSLLSSGDFLYIFTKDKTFAITTRALDSGIFNRILISNSIGCVSHESISQIGQAYIFLHTSGLYLISGGTILADDLGLPRPISNAIDRVFKQLETGLVLKRAVGFTDILNKRYLLFIPKENSNVDFSKNGEIIVFEYDRSNWVKWDNLNMAGGIAEYKDEIYFTERNSGKTLRSNTVKFLSTGTTNDYWDHGSPVDFHITTKWDALSDETFGLGKKLKSMKIFRVDELEEDALHNATYTVTLYKDLVDTLLHTKSNITFDQPGKKWNDFLWNDRPIGSWRKSNSKIRCAADLAEFIKIKISNSTGGVNSVVSGLQLEWDEISSGELK